MDITALPFNAHVGIARSEREGCLLFLAPLPHHENHLGTVHASVLFALAEASSGEFLIRTCETRSDIGGVVRRSSAKYSRPATGNVHSRVKSPAEDIVAAIAAVDARGKALVEIELELVDEANVLLASFGFTWLLGINEPTP